MRRAAGGFTLVELLVSALLLALVSAGVAIIMSTCLSAWRAGQERDALSQEANAILDTISQDVRSAFTGRKGFLVAAEEQAGVFALDCTTLSRRMQRLLYLSESGEPANENMSDLAQVAYFAEPAGEEGAFALYRQEICPPLPEPLAEEDRDPEQAQLLSKTVAALTLRFCDGQDWLDQWDTTESEGTASLPAAVEISLTLIQGAREQNYVARVPLFMGESAAGAGQ